MFQPGGKEEILSFKVIYLSGPIFTEKIPTSSIFCVMCDSRKVPIFLQVGRSYCNYRKLAVHSPKTPFFTKGKTGINECFGAFPYKYP